MRFLLALSFLLASCGVHEIRDKYDDTYDRLLVGVWDVVDANREPTACRDRLKLDSDKTFAWFDGRIMSLGTYGLLNNSIDFRFTKKPMELIRFLVTDRELRLYRYSSVAIVYTRVPTSEAETTLDCVLKQTPEQNPTPKPLPPEPDQKPNQKPDQKPLPKPEPKPLPTPEPLPLPTPLPK